jgi:hypothetical protein
MAKESLSYYDRQIALWIVRAYPSLKKDFDAKRRAIASAVPSPMAENDAVSYSVTSKAERIERLCETREYAQIRAVEQALEAAGKDIRGKAERSKLRTALFLNCTDRKHYPFHRLGVDFVSQRDFFRRRDGFLLDVLHRVQYGTAPR